MFAEPLWPVVLDGQNGEGFINNQDLVALGNGLSYFVTIGPNFLACHTGNATIKEQPEGLKVCCLITGMNICKDVRIFIDPWEFFS